MDEWKEVVSMDEWKEVVACHLWAEQLEEALVELKEAAEFLGGRTGRADLAIARTEELLTEYYKEPLWLVQANFDGLTLGFDRYGARKEFQVLVRRLVIDDDNPRQLRPTYLRPLLECPVITRVRHTPDLVSLVRLATKRMWDVVEGRANPAVFTAEDAG